MCERRPPRRLDEMSSIELRLACLASPARARSLLTVRAAISSAVSSLSPRFFEAFLDVLVLTFSLGAPRLLWHRLILSLLELGHCSSDVPAEQGCQTVVPADPVGVLSRDRAGTPQRMAIRRELVQLAPGATRFVRRDDTGQFADCVAVWSSLASRRPQAGQDGCKARSARRTRSAANQEVISRRAACRRRSCRPSRQSGHNA